MILQGPEFYISKRMGRAIMDHAMLAEGDRIAIALSGGVDSLTLLQVMRDRKSFVPIHYHLVAVHIDTGTSKKTLRALARFCDTLGVPFHSFKPGRSKDDTHAAFSWFYGKRREELLRQAQRLQCNTIALGQHKDDVVETMLLRMFFAGTVSVLPAHERISPQLSVIRPMVYVEKTLIRSFVKTADFPAIALKENSSDAAKRRSIAAMIRTIEKTCPEVKTNISRSLTRVKKDYLL